MDINEVPPIPLIAILGGGALAVLGIILYQAMFTEASSSDPFRERSDAQSRYMREVVERTRRNLGVGMGYT